MHKTLITILSLLFGITISSFGQIYNDHRGHNIDSLERVVARWDAVSIDSASEKELEELSHNWWELMKGYKQINGIKNRYYAEKLLALGRKMDWKTCIWDASKDIGEAYWAKDEYDSAGLYFGIALDAMEHMEVVPDNEVIEGKTYSQTDIDNLLSSLYGAFGNLYSVQDSISIALSYYSKALDLFKKHKWLNSCSVCYHNMAETVLDAGQTKEAKGYYQLALDYAHQSGDSLFVASALKGLGGLYLEQGKTSKALKYLDEADKYFSLHEDEEFRDRIETLDFTGQVLKLQKKHLYMWLISAIAFAILAALLFAVYRLLIVERKESKEKTEVLEETLSEIVPVVKEQIQQLDFKLNDRELSILKFLSEGKTTPQIAELLCLSPETIKWYRKKLLLKFDATSSAELVKKAIDCHIID